MPEPEEPTALYRLYDTEYNLLYIGISMNPMTRFKAHAHDKNWWHLVAHADYTWHPTFRDARLAEDAAHLSERPPFNSLGRAGLPEVRALRYDDSAEQAAVRDLVIRRLDSGHYSPGCRVWPYTLSRETGYTRTTVYSVLERLSTERRLEPLCKTFEVPAAIASTSSHSTPPSPRESR
jgi:hypothetical protein